MVSMNHSFELDCNEKKLFKILTNYQNLAEFLPRKLQNLEILDENENSTTLKVTLFLKTLIKKEFSQKLMIKKQSENDLSLDILDGHAKGTHVEISLSSKDNKTICAVNSDVKLSLKTIVLIPILKTEYNTFVLSVFKKMALAANEIKI
tara:strand:+ start:326 stop:772 length:447 start_codon:yes stop_codon:yes gene_type:complete